MLWNVQDGPTRMNKCGITPNTKQVVMDSSINKGIALGMRYIKVYGIDIIDSELATNIADGNARLINKGNSCMFVPLPIDLLSFNSFWFNFTAYFLSLFIYNKLINA